jgi:Mn-dependent DtxR family transcriptional regulator
MLMRDLKAYMQANKRAGLAELAARLDAEPGAVEGMLEHMQAKGLVSKSSCAGGNCNSASCCALADSVVYCWVK